MKHKKTLVIHPQDKSTDFLIPIYNGIEHKTVLRAGYSKNEVRSLIDSHDRILMMGHGSAYGLFAVNQFSDSLLYIIDESFVEQLSKKEDNVFIWCYASDFVEKHKLKGFYTGMFISEVYEALYHQLRDVNQTMVDESNYTFSEIVSRHIEAERETISTRIIDEYTTVASKNKIAAYNVDRIYFKM